MGLTEVISLNKEKCQHCLACLLVCPVKLCNVVEPDGISVNPDLCIGCGECIRACQEKGHQARSGVDDFSKFLEELQVGADIGVLVAPAAAVNYGKNFTKILTALRKMGVKNVFDVSYGAEITTYQYYKEILKDSGRPLIAQPCPAVVSFIEIYKPELIPYLVEVQSPALNTALWLKSRTEFKQLKLAFLGPCLAKRREIHDPNTHGVVSYNITFNSLDRYLANQGTELECLEPSGFDTPEAERAVVFSQPGGLTDTFKRFGVPVQKYDIPRVEGAHDVYINYLPGLLNDIFQDEAPLLVDILNCQYGCNGGPAATHNLSHYQVERIMEERRAEQIEKHKVLPQADAAAVLKELFDDLDQSGLDFSRKYSDKSSGRLLRLPEPEEEERVWKEMHKLTEEERKINCASCGYGNCHSMMTAIVNKLNHVESCKYYLFKDNEINLQQVAAQAQEIEAQRDEIFAWNGVLEQTVAIRTTALRNLLDNASQGFLTFGSDLIISSEYSAECIRIFAREIQGEIFSRLIYPSNDEQRIFVETLIKKILAEKNQDTREIYLPLLPDEVMVGNKHISIEYKTIHDGSGDASEVCMVILTDITHNRMLENQVEQERNVLKMVVKVALNYNDFAQCVKEYQNFCQERLYEILDGKNSSDDKLAEILRQIHTFKGNFSQLEMIRVVQDLHKIETEFSDFRKRMGSSVKLEEVRAFFTKHEMITWLNQDLAYLENVLGEQFFNQEEDLVISKAKLIEIEKKMEALLSPVECNLLIPELRKLRYKPFDLLLKPFPEYVVKLAERFEKPIYPIEICSEKFLINPDKYQDFIKSLVHVFRNAVDHGLEAMDERVETGKDEYGKIECSISSVANNVLLIIRDDGRGIDPEVVKRKAAERGIIPSAMIKEISDEEALQLIFRDGLSTRDSITDLSGRGMGLAAVKSELSKIGGSVLIKTNPGEGTSFEFTLPIFTEEVRRIPMYDLMGPLIKTTKKFVEENTGLEVQGLDHYMVRMPERLELHKKTSFITIRGAVECPFILSMDEPVLRLITRNFSLEEMPEGEEDEYMDDVLAESTNIILGNSLDSFPGLGDLLIIDAPVSLSSVEGLVKYQKSQIWTCEMKLAEGHLCVSLVVPLEICSK